MFFSGSAGRASLRFVFETLFLVECLLTFIENEFSSAIFAYNCFVSHFETSFSLFGISLIRDIALEIIQGGAVKNKFTHIADLFHSALSVYYKNLDYASIVSKIFLSSNNLIIKIKDIFVVFDDEVDQLCPAVHVHFNEDVADMLLDRVDADG